VVILISQTIRCEIERFKMEENLTPENHGAESQLSETTCPVHANIDITNASCEAEYKVFFEIDWHIIMLQIIDIMWYAVEKLLQLLFP